MHHYYYNLYTNILNDKNKRFDWLKNVGCSERGCGSLGDCGCGYLGLFSCCGR